VFDPAKNNFHQDGKCTRWILYDDNGNSLLAVLPLSLTIKKLIIMSSQPAAWAFLSVSMIKKPLFLLFDTAKKWLQENGMQAMDGPINFGENDNFWGLLVEGFTHPSYGMNYNFPYYQGFF
jgi:hypothetical protein